MQVCEFELVTLLKRNALMTQAKRKPRGMPKSVTQGVRILGRVSGRIALLYDCRKAGGTIALESPAEKTVAQLADLDPRVIRLRAQPFTVDVVSGHLYHTEKELLAGRETREKNDVEMREYTPDLLLTLADGKMVVIEVKTEKYPGKDEYWEKVNLAANILRSHGYAFCVITIDYTPDHPLVQNADYLTSFMALYRGSLSPAQIATAERILDTGPHELGAICAHLKLNLRESPILLLSGIASTDLTASRVVAKSLLRRAGPNFKNLALLNLPEFQ